MLRFCLWADQNKGTEIFNRVGKTGKALCDLGFIGQLLLGQIFKKLGADRILIDQQFQIFPERVCCNIAEIHQQMAEICMI